MKPIEDGNIHIGVELIDTGVANLDAFVKMKDTEQKMKPIVDGNPDDED